MWSTKDLVTSSLEGLGGVGSTATSIGQLATTVLVATGLVLLAVLRLGVVCLGHATCEGVSNPPCPSDQFSFTLMDEGNR